MPEWKVKVGNDETTAVYDEAESSSRAVFVCAHGAGGSITDRGTLSLTKALRANGIDTVRFNFLYKEKGSGRPDQMPKLEACFDAVVTRAREETKPKTLLIGGRSMGGRAASMLASKGYDADGLMLYAYPLHPPGAPEKLRVAHLADITMPVICFSGTRDPFCTRELMMNALETVKAEWDMQWVDQADHSFHVPKSSGRTDAQVMSEMAEKTREWVNNLR
jgi:predicted alpha/beta-hydrolase family hydrolase